MSNKLIPYSKIKMASSVHMSGITIYLHSIWAFKMICSTVSTTLTFVSCLLSIFGGGFILLDYTITSTLERTDFRKLFTYVTVGDLLIAIGNLVGAARYHDLFYEGHKKFNESSNKTYCLIISPTLANDVLCKGQSIVTTYASLVTFVWTSILAGFLYFVVRRGANNVIKGKMKVGFHIIGWVIPGLIVGVAAGMGVLGEDRAEHSGPWCWIKTAETKQKQIVWMLLSGKLWEIIAYVITFVFFVLFHWRPKSRPRENDGQQEEIRHDGMVTLRRGDNRFHFVGLIMILLRLGGTLRFFLYIAGDTSSEADKALLYYQSIGDGAKAFINCVIYCFTDREIMSRYRCRRGYESINE